MDLKQSCYFIDAEKPGKMTICTYNFSEAQVSGNLQINGPKEWNLTISDKVTIPPGGRVDLFLNYQVRDVAKLVRTRVTINGDFGPAGQTLLSVSLSPRPGAK